MRFRTLGKERKGSALIEFALLAPVFFLLTGGLVEYVLYHYKIYALNQVVYEAARNLQTGEVRLAGNLAAQQAAFEANVCAEADWMIDCTEISVDVRNYATLSDINLPPITFDAMGVPQNFVFEQTEPSQYSVVRATMDHEFITPFLRDLMGIGPGLPAVVNNFTIVKNEPWA
jgi:Flp pilus assembly protein TadG